MKVEPLDWWRGLSACARKLVGGIGLGSFGIAFLVLKWRAKRLLPESTWELKLLLYEIAMVVGGIVVSIEALRSR